MDKQDLEPVPPALALWSLNHQTAKELPIGFFLFLFKKFLIEVWLIYNTLEVC